MAREERKSMVRKEKKSMVRKEKTMKKWNLRWINHRAKVRLKMTSMTYQIRR